MSSIKFIHLADVHLGKKQYNIAQRYLDYFKAFNTILNKAIEQEVDFILISGDLIDSDERISPAILKEIINSIQSFQLESKKKISREIPIICIEGNHENPFYTDYTWLKILAELDLLILLSGTYDSKNEKIVFDEYSSISHSGGKITIGNCAIYGMSYFGSATSDLFPLLLNTISKNDNQFSILMMHFGITLYDERKAGIDLTTSLSQLHGVTDYLALGHFHKQYILPTKNPWIYNPGSLEVNDFDESLADRGIFFVEVFENNTKQVKPLLCENGNTSEAFSIPNRRFIVIEDINISGINSFPEAQEFILDRLEKHGVPLKSDQLLKKENLDLPLLYFTIRGIIGYSQLEVDLLSLKKQILDMFNILGLRLNNRLVSSMDHEIALDSELSIDEIEQEIFLNTVSSETQYEPYNTKIFQIFSELKQQVDTKNPNYKKIGNQIEAWIKSDKKLYDEFFSNLELKRKTTEQVPTTKQIKKKKEAKKTKLTEEEKVEEDEPDFSEIDYKDLLDEDESGFDDLIDDEDWV